MSPAMRALEASANEPVRAILRSVDRAQPVPVGAVSTFDAVIAAMTSDDQRVECAVNHATVQDSPAYRQAMEAQINQPDVLTVACMGGALL